MLDNGGDLCKGKGDNGKSVAMIAQRNPNSPRVLETRPLTRADLEALRQPSARTGLKNLRDIHHSIARLFASGLRLDAIARQTGYSISRLSILRHDPAMDDLIARYRGMVDDSWKNAQDELQETLHRIAAKGARKIEERLDIADETNETLPLKELVAVTADAMDRVGYVKRTLNVNANIDFAKKLEEAIRRQQTPKVIDGEAA